MPKNALRAAALLAVVAAVAAPVAVAAPAPAEVPARAAYVANSAPTHAWGTLGLTEGGFAQRDPR
ncbi:hypothetical protein ACGFYP_32925 [Streptomyces sp. NPDC048370]|uniref:hypothetical protein n=1 Tax=Streptomyces sp. NPDC048370 TaxID=3365540 RepID=UPI0037236B30